MSKLTRKQRIERVVNECIRDGIAFCDTETTDDVFNAGIGPYHGTTYMRVYGRSRPVIQNRNGARVFGVAIASTSLKSVFVRIFDVEFGEIRKLLSSRRITTVWHNYAYDKLYCDVSGIRVAGPWEDTLLLARLWDDSKPHGLKPLYALLTGEPPDEEKDLKNDLRKKKAAHTRKGFPKGYVNYSFAERRIMDKYARGDVRRTAVLWEFLRNEVRPTEPLYTQDKRCVEIALDMTHRGLGFDVAASIKAKERVAKDIAGFEAALKDSASHVLMPEFNPASNKQVAELLTKKGVPSFILNKGGRASVGADILKGLERNGIESVDAKRILKYRKAKKLLSTYLEPLSKAAEYDGAIHAMWNVGGTKSGRFSGSNPNMQNIPRSNDTDPAKLRSMFVPRKGYVNWYVDYSQIELRMLAAMTQDMDMIDAYRKGSDLHALTSARLGISRQEAKPVNFGVVYGSGAPQMATLLNVSFAKAAQIIESWFDAYPSVKALQEELQRDAYRNGFVEDMFGRRYYYPAEAPHKAINALDQGGCSYILKRAMISVADALKRTDSNLLGCIHDELVGETPVHQFSTKTLDKIKALMEDVPEFTQHGVPLVAEASYTTTNWGEKHA